MYMSKFIYLVPGLVGVTLSAQAAVVVNLNDDNIANYLTIGNKSLVSGDNSYKFSLAKKVVLSNGLLKNKYDLFYKGVPVYNSILTNSENEGKQQDWHGQMLDAIQDDLPNVTPSFDKKSIINIAKDHFKVQKHDTVQNESATLYIYMNDSNKAELVYLVSFNIEGNRIHRPYYIINAQTGKVVTAWDGLTSKSAGGPGGNEKTGAYYYGRDFGPLEVSDDCRMTNANVDTYDMKNQTVGGTIFQFICPNNNDKPVNGGYSPPNDGHYFASMVLGMYQDWYNIHPLDTKLIVRVHYGNNYENAFWDGRQMTFGDGATRMYPLTSLDVMAHEISHGVTEKNSGLSYRGQSGGINEAFSDMAGEAAEDYMNQQIGKDNDWLVGGTIMKGPVGYALRYFKDPTMDGASISKASQYNDSMDVHHTSGVFNKAFYNLATKPNWDIRKAFSVFLAANQVYWTPNATFNSAACGVAKAAKDFSYEVSDVISSFKDVEVDANCQVTDPDKGTEVEIANGTIINNIAVKSGSESKYLIKVPVVRTYPYSYDILSIRVFNATNTARNNVQLFVRYEDGTLRAITKSKELLAGGNEMFNIQKPAAGSYHILIKGVNADTVSLSAVYGNLR